MVKLFFSYSHKDEDLRNQMETHLALLKRQGIITSWHDRRITAGSDFGNEIDAELESADIIVLLISANFLASDYCFEKEMNRALTRNAEGSAVVVPVILHPCDWLSSPFGLLRATPTDGKAISMHANQHEAYAIVAKDIRELIASRPALSNSNPAPTTPTVANELSAQGIRSSNLRVKRKFDDHERDQFLEDSYEYIARFFEGSMDELRRRNPQLKSRFKRLSATSFSASIYDSGRRVAQCTIWYGNAFHTPSIAYSNSGDAPGNSYNEMLNVSDDGYALSLRSSGMQFHGSGRDPVLSFQGAAEYCWEMLIKPLQ